MSAQLEHSVRGGKGREGAQELGPEPQEALKSPRDADAPTSAGARSSRRRCHTGVPTGLARCSPPARKGPPGPGNTGLTSLFRAIRKMQLLPSLKKDRRSWGSPGLSTPAAQARRLCACGSKPQAQIAGRAQPVPGPEGPITSGLRASTALVRYPRRPPTTSWSPQVLQTGVGSQGDRPAWPLPTGWFHKNLRCSHISVLFICFSKLASASSEALI